MVVILLWRLHNRKTEVALILSSAVNKRLRNNIFRKVVDSSIWIFVEEELVLVPARNDLLDDLIEYFVDFSLLEISRIYNGNL